MKNIGGLIKKERERLEVTQDKVAKITGIDRTTLSLYENGGREISLSNLEELAIFFGRSISYFLKNKKEEDILKVSYRATELSETDQEKIEWAKQFVINLYEMKNSVK